ncbi:MAG TPA: hypothetical protein VNO19_15155 [Gemmatimonadales bacterium]|nr:hypothetical protein [Gemmatimonadales bacterium]
MHPRLVVAYVGGLLVACGGVDPTAVDKVTGQPGDVASVRLFDPRGTELTLHTGLVDNAITRVEVRMFAPDGSRLQQIGGGVELALLFSPASLATSAPVPGQPLMRDVIPTAASGASGSQEVSLQFPGDGSTKFFGPFHVQVQAGEPGGVAEFRLVDAREAEYTQHVPLFVGDTLRLEARLFDSSGSRLANPAADIAFRFEPETLAAALPVPQLPFWRDLTATSPAGTEGSLFVSVRFLADTVTRTYGPIQVLVH